MRMQKYIRGVEPNLNLLEISDLGQGRGCIFPDLEGILLKPNVRTFLSHLPGNEPGFSVRSYPGINSRRAKCPANYT
jgi:hypothetical protein